MSLAESFSRAVEHLTKFLPQYEYPFVDPLESVSVDSLLNQFRNEGWSVAVHNDYRSDGEDFTFYLFTHPSGVWAKGEGTSDIDALLEVEEQMKVRSNLLNSGDKKEESVPATPCCSHVNHKLDTNEQVFFYEQEFYVLSNFSSFAIWCNGHLFATAEAAYHWHKFPSSPTVQNAIISAKSAHETLILSRQHKGLVRSDWDEVKCSIMEEILRAKVNQHEYVYRKLMQTGTRELVEDSWRDSYWGWGPDRKGENNLGKIWMKIREEIYNKELNDSYIIPNWYRWSPPEFLDVGR